MNMLMKATVEKPFLLQSYETSQPLPEWFDSELDEAVPVAGARRKPTSAACPSTHGAGLEMID